MSRKIDPSIRLMVSDAHDEAPTTDALADLSARYADLEEELAAARAGASRDAALLAEHRAQAAEDLATIEALRAEARAGRDKYAAQSAEHVRALATVRAVVHAFNASANASPSAIASGYHTPRNVSNQFLKAASVRGGSSPINALWATEAIVSSAKRLRSSSRTAKARTRSLPENNALRRDFTT